MSAVQAIRTTPPVTAPPGTGTTAAPSSILPDPAPISASGMTDAMSALYAAIAQLGQNSAATSANQVVTDQGASQKALQEEQAALQSASDNEATHGRGFFSSLGHLAGDVVHDATHLKVEQAVKDTVGDSEQAWNSPAFWNDLEKGALVVAKVAAAVGSVVVTAASFGAGAVTMAGVAILLSVGGEVVSDTQCMGKASAYVALGLDLGSVAAGGIGAAMPAGASTLAKTAAGVGIAMKALGGEAQVVHGAAHIKTQTFAANVVNADADAQHDIDQGQEVQQLAGWVIDEMKASDKATKGTLQSVQGAIEASDQATVTAAASISVKG